MNLGSIGQGIKNAAQSTARAVANIPLSRTNSSDTVGSNIGKLLSTGAFIGSKIEPKITGVINRNILGGLGYQVPSVPISSLLSSGANALMPGPSMPQMPTMSAPQGVGKTLLAPDVSGSQLRATRQSFGGQTPSAGTSSIAPAALNAAAPSTTRTGRAVVPNPPPAPSAGGAMAPMSAAASTPSMMPASSFTPRPADPMSAVRSSEPSRGFSAAVPMAAILRALAESPNRQSPSGYVATPESLNLGARPKKRREDTAF